MKKRNLFSLVLICIMMCFLTACGSSGGSVRVKYDLTLQDNLAYSVGAKLNTGTYQSEYRDKSFKLKGTLKSSGEDYHYIVANDGCCDFTMEVRLANSGLSWPDKMNKKYTIIAKYTWDKSGGTSGFYFNILEFC